MNEESLLPGERVWLRPTTPDEIPQFFAWATNPDPEVQRYFYGEKLPSYQEFLKEWPPHYFEESRPTEGRCYTILIGGATAIGVINYNQFDDEGMRVTFDIVIGERQHLGRGYGSDALRTLVQHVFAVFPGLETAIIGAYRENARAIRAYQKAGFRLAEVDLSDPYISAYEENLEGFVFLELRRGDRQLRK